MASATTQSTKAVDIEGIRKDMLWGEPHVPAVAHFNAAGDSPMPRQVLERVTRHMEAEATLGGYEAAANVQEELEAVYDSAAQLINAKPEEIALQVLLWRRVTEHCRKSHMKPQPFNKVFVSGQAITGGGIQRQRLTSCDACDKWGSRLDLKKQPPIVVTDGD